MTSVKNHSEVITLKSPYCLCVYLCISQLSFPSGHCKKVKTETHDFLGIMDIKLCSTHTHTNEK